MKKLLFSLLLGTGCGTSGEFGIAKFFVGNGWKHQSNVAMGSHFQVQATQGFWNTSLHIQGCDSDIVMLNGINASATGEGYCSFEAYDEESQFVDRFAIKISEGTKLHLYDTEDPNNYWNAALPYHFAMISHSEAHFNIAVHDDLDIRLHHNDLIQIETPDTWSFQSSLQNDQLSLYAHQKTDTMFSLKDNGALGQSWNVSVIDPTDIQSILIRISPPQRSIPRYGEQAEASVYGSYAYVAVEIFDIYNTPVVLPTDSVRIVGEESFLPSGPQGFWVEKKSGETVSVEIKIGERIAFAYVD